MQIDTNRKYAIFTNDIPLLAAAESGGFLHPSVPGVVPEELCLPARHLLRPRPLPVQLRTHTLQVKSGNASSGHCEMVMY